MPDPWEEATQPWSTDREVEIEGFNWREARCYGLHDPPTWGSLAEHCRRTLDADTACPIVLGPDGAVIMAYTAS